MSPVISPPHVQRRVERVADAVRRFFGWGRQANYGYELPAKRKVGPRRPVEHGPTKAPFSREHRRMRRVMARHSRARNR